MNDELVIANHLIQIINNSKQKAMKKVNEELIHMYWEIGKYLYNESQDSSYGDSYIDNVAKKIQAALPGIKGFNKRGLYRMKKFYETYREDKNGAVKKQLTQKAPNGCLFW